MGCARQTVSVGYPRYPAPAPAPKPEPEPMLPAASVPPTPAPAVTTPQPPPPAPAVLSPRQIAARNLAREGRGQLDRGNLTAAIDTLEQSLRLDARNGETYYYLAEAWHRQGNENQARQFHRLARTYLKNQANWGSKLRRQAGKLGM